MAMAVSISTSRCCHSSSFSSPTKPTAFLYSQLTPLRTIIPISSLPKTTPAFFRASTRYSPIKAMSLEAGIGVMGTKLGMMTYFDDNGKVVPVTVVGFREGNIVTQVKTVATDGYNAVQVGYRRVRDRKLTKPEMGHLQKVGAIPMRHLQEFRLLSVDGFEPNQRLAIDEVFKEGDLVDVSGTTIGKGFQGLNPFNSLSLSLSFSAMIYLFLVSMRKLRHLERNGRCVKVVV